MCIYRNLTSRITVELTRRRESKHPSPHHASCERRSRRSRPTICYAFCDGGGVKALPPARRNIGSGLLGDSKARVSRRFLTSVITSAEGVSGDARNISNSRPRAPYL